MEVRSWRRGTADPLVGVLALQGAYEEHANMLRGLNRPVRVELVRTAEEVRCGAVVRVQRSSRLS